MGWVRTPYEGMDADTMRGDGGAWLAKDRYELERMGPRAAPAGYRTSAKVAMAACTSSALTW